MGHSGHVAATEAVRRFAATRTVDASLVPNDRCAGGRSINRVLHVTDCAGPQFEPAREHMVAPGGTGRSSSWMNAVADDTITLRALSSLAKTPSSERDIE
jgi:hypothetical protein